MLATTFACTLLFLTQFGKVTGKVAVTECPQCQKQKCDENDNCIEGCIPGFAGRTCSHQCPPNCMDSICYYDDDTGTYPCSLGCNPGYYGFQCNTPCQNIDTDGKCDRFSGTNPDCHGHKYGKNCETLCKGKCGGLVCDNKGNCLKEVCVHGRYGADCRKSCEAECRVCHRDTGQCLKPKSKCSEVEKGSTMETNGNCDPWTNAHSILSLLCHIVIAACGVIIVYQTKTYFGSTRLIRIQNVAELSTILPKEDSPTTVRKRLNVLPISKDAEPLLRDSALQQKDVDS